MNKLIKVILFLIVGMVQAFAWGGLRGDTLAKELDEAVLNRSFYLQQREQRITQLKDMFLLSKISSVSYTHLSSGQTTRAFTPDLLPPDSPNGIDLADERLARKEIEPGLQLKPFIGRIEVIIERISIIQPEGYVHARSAMLGAFLLGKEARADTHDEVYGNRGVRCV